MKRVESLAQPIREGASPLGNEGRGLKPDLTIVNDKTLADASPLGNEGRGLKHDACAVTARTGWHRPSATRGAD